MSDRLAPWRRGRARHDPGKVVLDLAVAIALGGDCLADVAVVRAQPDLFGAVASDPAASRLVAALAADGDAAVDALRAATLAGDRDEPVAVYDQLGQLTSHTVRKVPVLSPAQLANLPARRVVAFRRGMPVTVGRAQMAWTRSDVRAAVRAARRDGADVLRSAEKVLRVDSVRVDTPDPDRTAQDRTGEEVRADADR